MIGNVELLAQNAGEAFGWGIGVLVVVAILGILALVLWVWALVDAIRNPALNDTERVIWVVVIVLLQVLGALVYLLAGRKGSRHSGAV